MTWLVVVALGTHGVGERTVSDAERVDRSGVLVNPDLDTPPASPGYHAARRFTTSSRIVPPTVSLASLLKLEFHAGPFKLEFSGTDPDTEFRDAPIV